MGRTETRPKTVDAIELAQHYFDLSNDSDLDAIRELMISSTTYSSANTGLFLGVDDIIAMQTEFHAGFESLNWQVNAVEEIKPGIVQFDFTFYGRRRNGETVQSHGIETVVVHAGKIQHIEIRAR